MKRHLLSFITLLAGISNMSAINNNTVEIVYSGTTATVTIADNISEYVTVESGTSSHVKIIQSSTFAGADITATNTTGEITYVLSGSSDDGEFYVEGAFKQTIELSGLTLTNPNGPALNIQNGKRTSLSAQKGTVNTLKDGVNEDYNGCIHCKGHLKLKGKGTLNVTGNSKHGIYSKEYLELKNMILNIDNAVKDAMHCQQYFLMESGTVTISGAGDDGIQVELDGTSSTGIISDHEDEDTGNFYMEDGNLTISNYLGYAIKADGTITYNGGTQNFDKSSTLVSADIEDIQVSAMTAPMFYDLSGRLLNQAKRGLFISKQNGKVKKVLTK